MENNKKIIIYSIIVGVLILIIIILLLIRPNTEIVVEKVNNSETFFKINHLINEHEKTNKYISHVFYAKQMFHKEQPTMNIYFINGITVNQNPDTEYINNVNYLLKIKGVSYELTKLDNITNIEEYANNYTDTNKNIDSTNIVPTFTYNEKSKLVYYISIFLVELDNNPENAYIMLTDMQKQQYFGVDSFVKNKTLIKNRVSTFIKDYITSTNDDETKYTIKLKNDASLTIYEKGVMDFEMAYEKQ